MRRNRTTTRTSRLVAALLGAAVACTGVAAAGPAHGSGAPASAPSAPTAMSEPTAGGHTEAPDPTAPDRWRIEPLAGGYYTVRWTAPSRLPSTSDRPTIRGPGLSFGPSTVLGDGRTVESVVAADAAPDPAVLDVVLSGRLLDERPTRPPFRVGGGGATADSPPATLLAAPDPGAAGPHPTVTSTYELPRLRVPGLPRAVEVVGHVVEPAPDAVVVRRPLVMFVPGRHAACYDPQDPDATSRRWPCAGRFEEVPTHLGFRYLQENLASQGFATVSVSINGVNAQDDALADGGADARARLVRHHLDHWVGLADERDVDLDQVVLVGHSRGGEGAGLASVRISLSAPYRIAGQVLLAPTNFASRSAPYVPTVTVLPYCDGDVVDLQGQRYTDASRDVLADDTALRSSVMVMGANHNFFNTEWTPGTAVSPAVDDWTGPADEPCGRRTPARLGAPRQRAVGKAYVSGAVRLFTGEEGYLPLFDGSAVTVPTVDGADVRSHALGGGRDVRRPGVDATPTRATGEARTRMCEGRVTGAPQAIQDCVRRSDSITPHWVGYGDHAPRRQFWEMVWRRPGDTGGLRFDRTLDLSGGRLEVRLIVGSPRAVSLRVRISDSAGTSRTLVPGGGTSVRPLMAAGGATKQWAQTLVVDPAGGDDAEGPPVDLTDIESVELVGGSGGGRVWVADLAAAPSSLAVVPARRAPQVHVGELTIDEGDPAGDRAVTRTASVPFTITGTVTRPGRLLVATDGPWAASKQRFLVDVAPGQRSGAIPVLYRVDRLDSEPAGAPIISVWPVEGLATDDYLGQFTVRDDDPTPTSRVRVTRSVREGQSMTVAVNLAKPVSYDSRVTVDLLPTRRARPLRGTDLPRPWLRRRGVTDHLERPLGRLRLSLSAEIRPGQKVARIEIPIRRDRVVEVPERVLLRWSVSVGNPSRRVSVVVRDGD